MLIPYLLFILEQCFDYICLTFLKQVQRILSISILLTIITLLSSCMSSIKITSVVEKNTEGDFLLKWEVSPDQEGDIEIYSAMTDNSVTDFSPVKTAKVAEQVAIVNPTGSGLRQYFILRTAGANSGILANRDIDMNKVKNFRDIGGYFTSDNRQLKWGQIYRSGDLSSATLYDQEKIRRLKIKTIIDFRSERTVKRYPLLLHPDIQQIQLPIELMDAYKLDEITSNKDFTRSDAIRYVQESYTGITDNYIDKFKEMFNILAVEDNYPVLLTESLGKDRVGIATFLILYAVGVPESSIIDDYMISEKNIDFTNVVENAQLLSESMQEAVTAMLKVDRAYINFLIEHIKTKYGSVDNYLEKQLDVTSGKRGVLKKYLLYAY